MSSIREQASRRTPVVLVSLAALAGSLLVVLLPSLLLTGSDTTGSIGLAVLAIACATLVHLGARAVALGSGTALTVPVTREAADRLLPGRATDPTHHPLRPRAPGTV
jgi:hypothetical protein